MYSFLYTLLLIYSLATCNSCGKLIRVCGELDEGRGRLAKREVHLASDTVTCTIIDSLICLVMPTFKSIFENQKKTWNIVLQ